jgi:hypothetical protein
LVIAGVEATTATEVALAVGAPDIVVAVGVAVAVIAAV